MNASTSWIGLLVRARTGELDRVRRDLEALPGVETFPVEAPGALGVWLTSADEHEAHERIERDIRGIDGVFAAWPVFAHHEVCGAPEAPSDRPRGRFHNDSEEYEDDSGPT